MLWNAYHLIIFMIIGAIGGSLGALFNSLNVNLTKYRMKYLYQRSQHRIWRFVSQTKFTFFFFFFFFITKFLIFHSGWVVLIQIQRLARWLVI